MADQKLRMSIQVVTVADREPIQPYLLQGWKAFNESLAIHGHAPTVLGWASPWRGLGSKPKLLKQAIEQELIQSEWIIFADAFDVAFVGSPGEIVAVARDFYPRARILWNGERNCFPREDWAKQHPETEHPYRFFNSGLSVGRTQDYLQILIEMGVDEWPDDHQLPDGSWHHVNDQHHFMEKFLFGQCSPHELKMEIDQEAKVFQTMVGESMDNFTLQKRGVVQNKLTKNKPLAFHWNGNSKTSGTMEPILKHLNLL